jgi:hypothetical protein
MLNPTIKIVNIVATGVRICFSNMGINVITGCSAVGVDFSVILLVCLLKVLPF